LEFADVVGDKSEPAGDCLSGDEQIVRADRLALPFQVGANLRGFFRRRSVQRKLDNRRNESFNFLSFLDRIAFSTPQNNS
jgi:hypothetical protein